MKEIEPPNKNSMLYTCKQFKNFLPSFLNIKIELFSYTRIYRDNSLIDICDRSDVIDAIYYGDKRLHADLAPDICPELLAGEYFLIDCQGEENPVLNYFQNELKFSNFLTITKKNMNYYETFWLASSQRSKFTNFCINNIQAIESFIQYFKKSTPIQNLVTHSERKEKIIRHFSEETKLRNKEFITNNIVQSGLNLDLDLENFSQRDNLEAYSTNREKYYICKNPSVFLTKRELECLYWCSQGKTAEETALILYLSKRTVESHLHRIKQKLDCHNKISLIRKIMALKIFKER